MNVPVRLFLGYFLVLGLAAWFVLEVFTEEVEPGLRQATEETLVDASHLLAELAAPDLAHRRINSGDFAAALRAARQREPAADIFGIKKEQLDFRVYITDAQGKVVYDSEGQMLGADFSRWKDIASVLRGEYGARTSRDDPDDPRTSFMYIAAPVFWEGKLIGVLSLAKPTRTLNPYVRRTTRRLIDRGTIMLLVSALIGLGFSAWLSWSILNLIRYARAVSAGQKAEPPMGGGRQFSELARALAMMREQLEGKQYVEKYIQNLTHEMKSPLTAILSAVELLEAPLPEAERQRFTALIRAQSARLQHTIERMLQLARVEQLQSPEDCRAFDLGDLVRQRLASCQPTLASRHLSTRIEAEGAFPCLGDAFLLGQAIDNLLENAIDFSPEHGKIHLSLAQDSGKAVLKVRDQGEGAPEYALRQLFERFYSLPRPRTGGKGTGLGLPFAREAARLHGGEAGFRNHPEGGAEAFLAILLA
ncbi:MAG: two-component system sensor histidine kinase CreC [Zoogloeaceae bacterium]|jgi:two-component system sensor histidine kinase CreC|nr:two-component system sensor histidine kinase CreC [Zoogloeaceae bacterium]